MFGTNGSRKVSIDRKNGLCRNVRKAQGLVFRFEFKDIFALGIRMNERMSERKFGARFTVEEGNLQRNLERLFFASTLFLLFKGQRTFLLESN